MTDDRRRDQTPDDPHAVRCPPEEGKPDQLHKLEEAEDRQQALVDEGLEETFPASDPVSVSVTRIEDPGEDCGKDSGGSGSRSG